MRSISTLQIEREEDRSYLEKVVTLMLNLSSHFDRDFNYFIMDFDFLKNVFDYIERITRMDPNLSNEIREKILKLHMNLFNECTKNDQQFFLKQISIILNDYNYHNSHVSLLFKCLKRLSSVGGVWEYIDSEKQSSGIFRNIHELTDLLPTFSNQEFEGFLDFLQAFLYDYESTANMLFETVNINLFMRKIHEFYEERTQYRNKERYLKGVQVLSRVLEEGVTVKYCFPTKDSVEKFMGMLMNIELSQHPFYGKYCLKVLRKFLSADFELVNSMIENGLMDFIPEVLEQKYSENLLIECIWLIQDII